MPCLEHSDYTEPAYLMNLCNMLPQRFTLPLVPYRVQNVYVHPCSQVGIFIQAVQGQRLLICDVDIPAS